MSDLVDRLRGKYTCKVDDGAGLLNGKDTFTRQFPVSVLPPIHAEAANEIERLQALIAELAEAAETGLAYIENGDWRNGNDEFGVDEGVVNAHRDGLAIRNAIARASTPSEAPHA